MKLDRNTTVIIAIAVIIGVLLVVGAFTGNLPEMIGFIKDTGVVEEVIQDEDAQEQVEPAVEPADETPTNEQEE